MSVVNLPTYDELIPPTLDAISAAGGSASIEEIETHITAGLGLSDEHFGVTYPRSGALVLPDRMSWARSYLKGAGFLENPKRGVWVLSDKGREAATWEPEKIRQVAVKTVQSAHAAKKSQKQPKPSAAKAVPLGGEVEVEDWSNLLLKKVQSITPDAFERLCKRLLRESGFVKVEVTGGSGDGGIDGAGVLRMNLISFQVLFQCKRYTGSVSASTIRDFRGAMQGRADKGLIITTGTFTQDARREATRDGAPAIDLIDGELLCELLKERGLGVSLKLVEEVTVDEAFFGSI